MLRQSRRNQSNAAALLQKSIECCGRAAANLLCASPSCSAAEPQRHDTAAEPQGHDTVAQPLQGH